MKYKFGDALIKNNRAYIVLGEGGIGEYHQYYLQSRSGTLAIRSKEQIDNLIKRGYELHKGHCNLTYPVLRDFKIGDLIIGRRHDDKCDKFTKQSGIIINIRRKKKYFYGKGYTKEFTLLWSNGEHEKRMWTQIEHLFVPFSWHNISSYHRWKHLRIIPNSVKSD